MMMELFNGTELILIGVLTIIWVMAGVAVNNLLRVTRDGGDFRRRIRLTRLFVVAGVMTTVLWVILQLLTLVILNWLFVMDRFVIMLPLLALPTAAVVWTLFPSLNVERDFLTPGELAPGWISVHASWAGSVLVFRMLMVDIPAIPDLREATLHVGLLAGAVVFFAWKVRRSIKKPSGPPASRMVRLFRNVGRGSVFLILTLSGSSVSGWTVGMAEEVHMAHPVHPDFGGGSAFPVGDLHHDSGGAGTVSVTRLTGPRTGIPDKRFTLVAEKKNIRLASGREIEAWTFNGQVPGPALTVRKGDLVEVKLVNKNIDEGVTLHWHGVDVPNAEDGVAGMTQNAVKPGETHVYRFVVNETGTHWYHSHQVSSVQVKKGLFGPFIILPDQEEPSGNTWDMTIFSHDWDTKDGNLQALNLNERQRGITVKPGTKVRLRLINSASDTRRFNIGGTGFRVTAIDGHPVHRPQMLQNTTVEIGGGGRYDVEFIMPSRPVALVLGTGSEDSGPSFVFSEDGKGKLPSVEANGILDPTTYGSPAKPSFDLSGGFDREFTMMLDQTYVGGESGSLWLINGELFPRTPTFMVEKGDRVKTVIVNRSWADHPMHLHGHHIQVLSKNGRAVSGSPLVLDTLLVKPGEWYEVAFEANNPGLWMDHCHNLDHAATGMVMHLAYRNVTTPFKMGGHSGNHPE